jgi:hypothetical protein
MRLIVLGDYVIAVREADKRCCSHAAAQPVSLGLDAAMPL